MLQTNKSKTINGSAVIEDRHVVDLHATLSNESTSVGYTISDNELYMKNKDECRESIMNFLKQVFESENEIN